MLSLRKKNPWSGRLSGYHGEPRIRERWTHRRPLEPGEPRLSRSAGQRVGTSNHLDLEIRLHRGEWHHRMIDVPPSADEPHLFAGRRGEDDRAFRLWPACHLLCDFDDSHRARRVVVGAVVHGIRSRLWMRAANGCHVHAKRIDARLKRRHCRPLLVGHRRAAPSPQCDVIGLRILSAFGEDRCGERRKGLHRVDVERAAGAKSEVIVVRVNEHDGVLQHRVAAAQNSNHVHGQPALFGWKGVADRKDSRPLSDGCFVWRE